MSYRKIVGCALTVAVAAIGAVSCSEIELQRPFTEETKSSVPVITAILPGETDTRTALSYEDYRLKASWVNGDSFAVVPDGDYNGSVYSLIDQACIYSLSGEGGTTADFTAQGSLAEASTYTIFYPSTIKSYAAWTCVDYSDQTQDKSDPMAHLSTFHTMRVESLANVSTIDFSGATQSSCMKFNLSGMTFDSPTKISLLCSSTSFCSNNVNYMSYAMYTSEKALSPNKVSELSLNLSGYGSSEESITAFMMMSNANVSIPEGSKVTIKVTCADGVWKYDFDIDSQMQLTGGHCHTITVDSGWTKSNADYTKYPFDGEVVTVQETGSNLDIIFMGDGYIAEDITNGTYEAIMMEAIDNYFSILPLSYFRDRYNIYYVKAVSPERTNAVTTGANGASNTGTETKFACQFTPNSTSISGDHDLVLEYGSKALTTNTSQRLRNALFVVIANQECRSGTCYNMWYSGQTTDYGEAFAIAYFGLGHDQAERTQLLQHEANGHGFGKLSDEYYYNQYYSNPSSKWTELEGYHSWGMGRNVDVYVSGTTSTENVYWSKLFGTANNYESESVESLGVFEGAYTVAKDFCRPTKNGAKSIMSQNTGIFNAISRYQIWYRAMSLSGGVSGNVFLTDENLAEFLEWDKTYFLPTLATKTGMEEVQVNPAALPLAPPVNYIGHWDEGKFIVEKCL